jgi:hypothetical protein
VPGPNRRPVRRHDTTRLLVGPGCGPVKMAEPDTGLGRASPARPDLQYEEDKLAMGRVQGQIVGYAVDITLVYR